jgi:transcriptional regulator
MYIPAHFAEPDAAAAHALIDENSFGLLVVPTAGGVEMAHVPFVLDRDDGPLGTLRVHVARVNPVVPALEAGAATAVFTGPHAYVSPRWYEAKHRSVPTWDFAAVHAHGAARRIDDEREIVRALTDLTAKHEAGAEPPWSPSLAERDYFEGLLKAIVLFSIRIERLETKVKMSQDRSAADQASVAAALRARAGPGDLAVAAMVEARGKARKDPG